VGWGEAEISKAAIHLADFGNTGIVAATITSTFTKRPYNGDRTNYLNAPHTQVQLRERRVRGV
jgi:hypothetical protein